jgi:hypothetical protein
MPMQYFLILISLISVISSKGMMEPICGPHWALVPRESIPILSQQSGSVSTIEFLKSVSEFKALTLSILSYGTTTLFDISTRTPSEIQTFGPYFPYVGLKVDMINEPRNKIISTCIKKSGYLPSAPFTKEQLTILQALAKDSTAKQFPIDTSYDTLGIRSNGLLVSEYDEGINETKAKELGNEPLLTSLDSLPVTLSKTKTADTEVTAPCISRFDPYEHPLWQPLMQNQLIDIKKSTKGVINHLERISNYIPSIDPKANVAHLPPIDLSHMKYFTELLKLPGIQYDIHFFHSLLNDVITYLATFKRQFSFKDGKLVIISEQYTDAIVCVSLCQSIALRTNF